MSFYKFNWKISLNQSAYREDILEFVTKLLKNKTHYFLFLKMEIKPNFIYITGYSLVSLSNIDDDDCLLWRYIYNSIDIFIEIALNYVINEIENDSKNIIYINCFGKFMSTYNWKY
jgi:hypothetical protein